jgi:uncharacterized membrane protein YfhO/putative flippase GtrA
MRSIIKELLYHHRLVIPQWEFALGEGNDILQTLHYYVMGDPFAVCSVFVPTRFMWIYYDFMILLRLYLAGIAFSCLCFYTKKDIGRYAVMAGAMTYVFCYWALLNVNRHPYFLNPMLYFPLIVLGIEKILQEKKKCLLTVAVFLAAVSNFYFFYVIVFLTVVYVAIRLLVKYKKDFASMGKALLSIAGCSVLGTMMSFVILLPVIAAALGDARMDSGNSWHLIYPITYYLKLPRVFFGEMRIYWLCMGYSAPVLVALLLLFLCRKEYRTLKWCFFVCLVIVLVPALGQFLNGMSYMCNRWSWVFALLCAYIFAVMWKELMNLSIRDAIKLTAGLCVCTLGMLLTTYSRSKISLFCMGIAFVFLFILFPVRSKNPQVKQQRKRYQQPLAFACVLAGIWCVSFFQYAYSKNDYTSEAKTIEDAENLMQTDARVVDQVASAEGVTDYYRYSGRKLRKNANFLMGVSSTQYYWSISNSSVTDYMKETELIGALSHLHEGYDDRSALLSLSSVLYYVIPASDSKPVPYGYTYVNTYDADGNIVGNENSSSAKYQIYRNDYALPIAYVYDTSIDEDTWEELSAVEKQEAMIQSVRLEGYEGENPNSSLNLSSQSLDYTIECKGEGITLEDNGFLVTKTDSSVTIRFEGLENCETYFTIKGLEYEDVAANKRYFGVGTTEADLKLKASSGASKTIKYYTADYEWYNDLHDYSVNLDYSEEAVTSMKLTFSEPGFYSFDSIGIVCQPMDNYADQIASLKSSALENVEIGTNTVSGTIALDQPKFLCFSIPYSKGWTAYVDGEEATLYQANVKNMALSLDEGTHDIVLTYHTPYLKLGVLVSVGGFVIFIVIGCFEIRKRKKREPGTHKEVISYLFWGVMTTLVSWISYSIFVTLMQSVSIANVLSWICAVLFAFVTNKLWVFQSKEWAFRIMIPEFLKFVTARLATGVMEIVGVPLLVYLGLDQKIAGIEGMAAKVLVSIVVIILNYVLSKLLVFRNKQEPERKENG